MHLAATGGRIDSYGIIINSFFLRFNGRMSLSNALAALVYHDAHAIKFRGRWLSAQVLPGMTP